MLRLLGLVLTTSLFLGVTSCTSTAPTNNANATPTVSKADTPTTPSPTTPSPSPTSTAPTTATVKGSNFKWQDDASGNAVTTIKVGGTITWTIVNGRHSLERVAQSQENGCDELEASFNSEDLTSGKSVTRTFNKVGTFGYRCGIHGGIPNCKTPPGTSTQGDLMPGVIKVVP